MSPTSPAAQRRRSCLLATTFLAPALFGVSAAHAQQIAQALPPIEITSPDEIIDTNAPFCEPSGQRMWLTRVETKVGASIESKKQYECKECGAQIWTS